MLYIARYYFYEKNVLEEIQQRANKTLNVDTEKIKPIFMQRLFPENSAAEIDWQKWQRPVPACKVLALSQAGQAQVKPLR